LDAKIKPVRLSDVAKAAGVSHGTASNVFSRPEIVREEVRERVKAAAEKLGYGGPDPKGRLLRAGKVNAIGVATAEPLSYFFDDPFSRVVMSGISEACDRTGAGISLVSAANEEQLVWNIRSALVDGFIVFCLEGGSRLVELTRERGLPFVALDFGFDAKC
jgi:DNA-binding LacI/PurR family transcriptional regulator